MDLTGDLVDFLHEDLLKLRAQIWPMQLVQSNRNPRAG